MLGDAYYGNGQYIESKEAFLKAQKLNPNDSYINMMLENIYDILNKVKGDIMLEQNNNANDLFEKGKSFYENERYSEAIEYLLKAKDLNPNDYNIWLLLGSAYTENGQPK